MSACQRSLIGDRQMKSAVKGNKNIKILSTNCYLRPFIVSLSPSLPVLGPSPLDFTSVLPHYSSIVFHFSRQEQTARRCGFWQQIFIHVLFSLCCGDRRSYSRALERILKLVLGQLAFIVGIFILYIFLIITILISAHRPQHLISIFLFCCHNIPTDLRRFSFSLKKTPSRVV